MVFSFTQPVLMFPFPLGFSFTPLVTLKVYLLYIYIPYVAPDIFFLSSQVMSLQNPECQHHMSMYENACPVFVLNVFGHICSL